LSLLIYEVLNLKAQNKGFFFHFELFNQSTLLMFSGYISNLSFNYLTSFEEQTISGKTVSLIIFVIFQFTKQMTKAV
jgi:hypothetical protein